MTTYLKFTDIVTKIENDLNLLDEQWISPTEMQGYVNEGVREIEAEILTLYEDYFLARVDLNTPTGLVSGQESYDLPSNIYAHKIRRMIYQKGATVYAVERLKDWHKFEKYTEDKVTGAGTVYAYLIDNTTPTSPKIVFAPPVKETGLYVKIWYIRTANRYNTLGGTEVCDLPEFVNLLFQYVKVRAYEKEGHPNLGMARLDLERERESMNQTLSAMVPDGENNIEPDLTFYEDMT